MLDHFSKKTGPGYRFTIVCRLQLAMLENTSAVCSKIGLTDHHLGPVLEASLPYLGSGQHPVLQQVRLFL